MWTAPLPGLTANGNATCVWITKVQSGYLKDLGISLRHASLRSEVTGQRDVDEVRAILSYSFVLR